MEVKLQRIEKPRISKGLSSFIENYRLKKKALVATKEFWGETRIGGARVKFVPPATCEPTVCGRLQAACRPLPRATARS